MSDIKENITDALNMFFDFRIESFHTLIPGKIVSFDEDKRLASVQPLIQLRTSKEVDIEYPTIKNVPLIFPSGKVFNLRWDIEKDDGCLILFAESGIGNFINSSDAGQVACEDSSRFSLTDAICIPGLYSSQRASNLQKDVEIYVDKKGVIQVKNKKATFELSDDGTIKGANEKGAIELGGSDGKFDVNGNLTVDA